MLTRNTRETWTNTKNNDIQLILAPLKQVQELQTTQVQVRVFLTSRPTEEIDDQIGQMPLNDHKDERLLKIPLPRTNDFQKDDITLFF